MRFQDQFPKATLLSYTYEPDATVKNADDQFLQMFKVIFLEYLFRPWWHRASSLEAPGLHDTDLDTLSTQTTRGQELFGHVSKAAVLGGGGGVDCLTKLLGRRCPKVSVPIPS